MGKNGFYSEKRATRGTEAAKRGRSRQRRDRKRTKFFPWRVPTRPFFLSSVRPAAREFFVSLFIIAGSAPQRSADRDGGARLIGCQNTCLSFSSGPSALCCAPRRLAAILWRLLNWLRGKKNIFCKSGAFLIHVRLQWSARVGFAGREGRVVQRLHEWLYRIRGCARDRGRRRWGVPRVFFC